MSLYKRRHGALRDLPRALACLPADELGHKPEQVLQLWRKWYAEGSLQVSWVETVGQRPSDSIQFLGVSLWITDAAVEALRQVQPGQLAHRVYAAALSEPPADEWVMRQSQVHAAHASQTLNLLTLHIWFPAPATSPEFLPVFVQGDTMFWETYRGFGIQWYLQEVPTALAGVLQAGGLKVLRGSSDGTRTLLGLSRLDAAPLLGTSLSFLFFSPQSTLGFRPSVQRMLCLALKQYTDEDIANALDCSRDYVRKLWREVYEVLETARVLPTRSPSRRAGPRAHKPATSSTLRGRERRRLALEFLRSNLQELRPGMPE